MQTRRAWEDHRRGIMNGGIPCSTRDVAHPLASIAHQRIVKKITEANRKERAGRESGSGLCQFSREGRIVGYRKFSGQLSISKDAKLLEQRHVLSS